MNFMDQQYLLMKIEYSRYNSQTQRKIRFETFFLFPDAISNNAVEKKRNSNVGSEYIMHRPISRVISLQSEEGNQPCLNTQRRARESQ